MDFVQPGASPSQIGMEIFQKVQRKNYQHISFFAKQFCIPKEIKLIDSRTGDSRINRENIQIVDRLNPFDTNPIFRDITPIQLQSQTADPSDGLLSLIKSLNIKIAICITVYSQQKQMLKRTLQGIRKNYDTFYQKAGIHSHQIAIFIIFDGIEHMNNQKNSDANMLNLFRQFDLINGFRKKQYLLAKDKDSQQQHSADQESFINGLENFADQMMFTEEEYQALEKLLLESQYARYKAMAELLEFADDIQNKKLHNTSIDNLPSIVNQALIIRARQYLQQNGIQQITQNNKELQDYISENLPQYKIDLLKIEALKDSVQIAKQYIKSRQNTAILYQMSLPLQKKQQMQDDPKMILFSVVKYSNRGKLSSHLWFFQGFCNMVHPSVCILLDCGLQPNQDALFKVWAHIQTYKRTCGGVCGYMKLRMESPYDQSGNRPQADAQSLINNMTNFFFDVQKAQIFQYHMSHLIDKPFESLTGYIHVLPGAFSGYNWDALKSEKFKVVRSDGQVFLKDIQKRTKQQILKKYLKTVIYNQVLDNIEQANMYLAEDRILCLQIYTKKKNNFDLQYLPDAQANVDPITTLPKLLSQRKRWINGSWFALDYVIKNKGRVGESSHHCWDKFWFHFNMIHAQIMQYASYLAIAFFFVILHMMVLEFSQTTLKQYFMQSYSITEQQLVYAKIFWDFFAIRSVINSFTKLFDFIFITSISILIYRSLTLKRQDTTAKRSFNTISSWLGILGLFSLIIIFVNFYQSVFNGKSKFTDLMIGGGLFTQQTFIYLLVFIVGVHLLAVLSAFNCKTYLEIVGSMFSYFFYAPSYVNLFFIYAFCRIDDLSWGTKGLDSESKAKQSSIRQKFTDQKILFTIKWLTINVIVSLVLIGLSNNFQIQNFIIWIFSAYFALMMLIKVVFAMVYQIRYFTIKKIKVALMTKTFKEKNMRISKKCKKLLKLYVKKMKDQNMDHHVEQINQELIKKQIFNQPRESREGRESRYGRNGRDSRESRDGGNIGFGDKEKVGENEKGIEKQRENQSKKGVPEGDKNFRRISFQDLKRISNIGLTNQAKKFDSYM